MSPKVTHTRQEKALQTKAAIYQSAERLFKKYAFEAVNVEDIVKEAKVSKGSFYVHYPSKDALIALFISDYVVRVDEDYKNHINALPKDMTTSEVLLSLVGKIAEVIEEDLGRHNMKTLYRIQLTDASPSAALAYGRELYQLFHGLIEKGLAEKTLHSDLSPEETAKHFVMGYRGLVYEWCVREDTFSLKEEALKHYQMLLYGLTSP